MTINVFKKLFKNTRRDKYEEAVAYINTLEEQLAESELFHDIARDTRKQDAAEGAQLAIFLNEFSKEANYLVNCAHDVIEAGDLEGMREVCKKAREFRGYHIHSDIDEIPF